MVKVTDPPATMDGAEKLFVNEGGESVTASGSVAVHAAPGTQVAAPLVLKTELGGVMTAVLVTPVCACALDPINANDKNSKASTGQTALANSFFSCKNGRLNADNSNNTGPKTTKHYKPPPQASKV